MELKARVPAPVLLMPLALASTELIVVWLLMTLMTGVVLAASMRALPLTIQLLSGEVSPKMRPPMVCGPDNVTVAGAVRSSVLKSAVLSAPVPMMPFNQLALLVHVPPASSVHVAVFRMEALKLRPVGWVSE
jgi:hypothetical protein